MAKWVAQCEPRMPNLVPFGILGSPFDVRIVMAPLDEMKGRYAVVLDVIWNWPARGPHSRTRGSAFRTHTLPTGDTVRAPRNHFRLETPRSVGVTRGSDP